MRSPTRCPTFNLAILLFGFGLVSPKSLAQTSRPERLICKSLERSFLNFAETQGLCPLEAYSLASEGREKLITAMRSGDTKQFISTQALFGEGPEAFLPLTSLFAPSLGLRPNVTLALSPAELRHLPYAQEESDILLIATTSAPLTPARAQSVIAVAKHLGIRIFAVWVGPSNAAGQELAAVAMATGGAFVNYGGQQDPCQAH